MSGSPTDTLRAFIAARPNEAAQAELIRVQRELKKQLVSSDLRSEVSRAPSTFSGSIKWTDPETFHITLLFLGDIPQIRIADVLESLESAGRGRASCECSLSELGLFKKSGALWVGIHPSPELSELQKSVSMALQMDPGRFHAHFTLGRIKRGVLDPNFFQTPARRVAHNAVGGTGKVEVQPVSFTIRERELVKSELFAGGARHTVLGAVLL